MLDWLIVGGGIHGVHIAHSLLRRNGVSRDRLCVVDPHADPLARWNHCTANVGMRYLRSPSVHHLGLDSEELTRFGRTPHGRALERYSPPYDRPAYDFFQAHARQVVTELRLPDCWVQGTADGLRRIPGGWGVQCACGEIQARRVVLALGRTALRMPDWAALLQARGAPVDHIFAPDFRRADLPDWHHAVVVGGGISAGQTALALAKRHPGAVTLLLRRPIDEHQFDSDPCWNGPKCLRDFHACRDYGQRRRLIAAARHPGSMPKDILIKVRHAVREGTLHLCEAEVTQAEIGVGGQISLSLSNGDWLNTDRLLLATGFRRERPGGAWIDRAIAEFGLSCAPCGYPIVDALLNWAPGLHVSGPLAELEIGATSPNIRGARAAAERLGQIQ
jgi:hypothetical protein